jgi:hypothetical protein
MAQLRRSLNLGILLAAGFLTPAFGAPPTSKIPPAQVTAVWIKGQSGPAERELFVAVGDATPVPLMAGGSSRGRPADVQPGATLRLLAKAPGTPAAKPVAPAAAGGVAPAAANKPTFVPVGEVAWPKDATRKVLLVLAASKGADGAVRAVAMNDDESVFPVHTVRVVNFTSATFLMRFNQSVKNLPPGTFEPIPYGVTVDPKAKDTPDIPFALAADDQIFFNGFIDPKPQSRTLVFVVPPTGKGTSPVVQFVRERLTPPPGAAPGARPPPRT